MKNLIIVLIFAFISDNVFSQEELKSGEVIYSIKTKEYKQNPKESPKHPMFMKFQKRLYGFSEKLKYTLKFNKNNSFFYLNSDLPLDGEDEFTNLALIINRSESKFYFDNTSRTILEEKSSFGEDFIVKSSSSDLKWELINEKKIIGEYTCYKAVTKIKKSGPKLEGRNMFASIIAWYCPTISFNYGPMDFNSLPGLILELSIKDFTYFASTIKLGKDTIEITKPKKGKLITKEEFENIGRKSFDNR